MPPITGMRPQGRLDQGDAKRQPELKGTTVMPDTAESRVNAHRVAQSRRALGLPTWRYTVDVSALWRDEPLTFEERRDTVASVLRASTWFASVEEHDDTLLLLVENLEEADDVEEFDLVWDAIYDLADADRTWIKTVV